MGVGASSLPLDVNSENQSSPDFFLYTGESGLDVPRHVTRVRIDPSVRIIPNNPFLDCEKLREVHFCEGLEELGEYVFAHCISLELVTFPSTLKVIPRRAFQYCIKLREVHFYEGLEEIGKEAFYGCISLEKVTFPSSLKVISRNASISGGAFQNCKKIRELFFCEGLEEIGVLAFAGCEALEKVRFPSTLKVISRWAFHFCEKLGEFHLYEGLEEIGDYAFAGCHSLERVKIPSTVKVISRLAFMHCKKLRDAHFCEGLKEIGEGAFEGCISLKRVKLPSTLKVISWGAFLNCDELEEVDLCESLNWGEMLRSLIEARAPFWRIVHFNLPKLSKRADSLSTEQWKMSIEHDITNLPRDGSEALVAKHVGTIQSKLTYFELKEVTTLLELAVWKAKIDDTSECDVEGRGACRVKCGADVVLPRVVSYLFNEEALQRALDAMELA